MFILNTSREIANIPNLHMKNVFNWLKNAVEVETLKKEFLEKKVVSKAENIFSCGFERVLKFN